MTRTTQDTLAATLPYLQALQGKVLVVKYGGNAMTEPALQQAFAHDIVLLQALGMHPVVVHGGGPQIDAALKLVGKEGQFVQGMRVTDAQTMQVVQWVLLGQVQAELVGLITQAGGRAVGISGRDGGLIRAQKMLLTDATDPSKKHDIGQVGEVVAVQEDVIWDLIKAGYIPVISPVGADAQNTSFNVNADVVAGKVAAALEAEKLLLLTNISGVLDQDKNLIRALTPEKIAALAADGTISGGMLPKLQGALDAAHCGVKAVHILDGRVPHAMLQAVLSDEPCGTAITAA